MRRLVALPILWLAGCAPPDPTPEDGGPMVNPHREDLDASDTSDEESEEESEEEDEYEEGLVDY